jgi:hypothetical protein
MTHAGHLAHPFDTVIGPNGAAVNPPCRSIVAVPMYRQGIRRYLLRHRCGRIHQERRARINLMVQSKADPDEKIFAIVERTSYLNIATTLHNLQSGWSGNVCSSLRLKQCGAENIEAGKDSYLQGKPLPEQLIPSLIISARI